MITCTRCHQQIAFVLLTKRAGGRSRVPVNPDPDPAGNIAAYQAPSIHKTLLGRVLRKQEEPLGFERKYMSHFATCTAKKAPEPVQAPSNVTLLSQYRNRKHQAS
jgi:hypothetical protein